MPAPTTITDSFAYTAGRVDRASNNWRQLGPRGIQQGYMKADGSGGILVDPADHGVDGRATLWQPTRYCDDFEMTGTWTGLHPSEGGFAAWVDWTNPQVAIITGLIWVSGSTVIAYIGTCGKESFEGGVDNGPADNFGNVITLSSGITHTDGVPVAMAFRARSRQMALYCDGTRVVGPVAQITPLRLSNRHGVHIDQHDSTTPGAGAGLVGAFGQTTITDWQITGFTGTL